MRPVPLGLSKIEYALTVRCMWTPRPVTATAVSVVLALIALGASGCTFDPDPTEDSFDVHVTNDTDKAVILSTCGTGNGLCLGKTYQTGKVAPGDGWRSAPTSVGQLNPILVQSVAGRRMGCLPLYYSYNAQGTTVRVSEMVRCQEEYPIRGPDAQR
jgi:hypothetical protein